MVPSIKPGHTWCQVSSQDTHDAKYQVRIQMMPSIKSGHSARYKVVTNVALSIKSGHMILSIKTGQNDAKNQVRTHMMLSIKLGQMVVNIKSVPTWCKVHVSRQNTNVVKY